LKSQDYKSSRLKKILDVEKQYRYWPKVKKYYFAGRFYTPRPTLMLFNITNRCNSRCVMCNIWLKQNKEHSDLSLDEVKYVFNDSFIRENIDNVWLSGGEPVLREDLAEIASIILGSCTRLETLNIASNGLNPDLVMRRVREVQEVLEGSGVELVVQVSLDGIGETHDKIRNISGAYEKAERTIEELKELKERNVLELILNCVVQPENAHQLNDIHEYAKSSGLHILFSPVAVAGGYYDNVSKTDKLVFNEEQKNAVISFMEELADGDHTPVGYFYRSNINILKGGRRTRRCVSNYLAVYIEYDGSIGLCPYSGTDLKCGQILEQPLKSVWYSRKTHVLKTCIERERCPTCTLSCTLGCEAGLKESLAFFNSHLAGLRNQGI